MLINEDADRLLDVVQPLPFVFDHPAGVAGLRRLHVERQSADLGIW